MANKVIENKYIEMIHASFDGELTPTEQAELDLFLEGNEEARAYRASLEKLDDLLQEVGEPAVPLGLKRDILASINPTNGRQSGSNQATRKWPVHALAMAASVVVAISLIFFVNPLNINDMDSVSGTIVGQQEAIGSHQVVQADGLTAEIGIEWEEATLVINIGLESKSRTITTLEFPEDQFVLEPVPEAREGTGEASIELSGDADIALRFQQLEAVSKDRHSIRVTFSQDGKTVSTAALLVPPQG